MGKSFGTRAQTHTNPLADTAQNNPDVCMCNPTIIFLDNGATLKTASARRLSFQMHTKDFNTLSWKQGVAKEISQIFTSTLQIVFKLGLKQGVYVVFQAKHHKFHYGNTERWANAWCVCWEVFLPALQSCFGSSGHIHLQQEGKKIIFYLKKKSRPMHYEAGYFISTVHCCSQAPGAFVTHLQTNTFTKIKMKHSNHKV